MSRTVRILINGALVVAGAFLLSSLAGEGGQGKQHAAAVTTPRPAIGSAVAASVAAETPTLEGVTTTPKTVSNAACENTGADPGAAEDLYRASVLCLLNAQRKAYSLHALRSSTSLLRAARAHSRDMVARKYFDHDTLDGGDFSSRILRSGFAPPGGSYNIGENIAWGAQAEGTPQAIVNAWMDSPPHKANILKRGFRRIGIGLAKGAPTKGDLGDAVTATTDFG